MITIGRIKDPAFVCFYNRKTKLVEVNDFEKISNLFEIIKAQKIGSSHTGLCRSCSFNVYDFIC